MSAVALQVGAISDYRATEDLRDGRRISIRALRPEDRGAMLEALARAGLDVKTRREAGVIHLEMGLGPAKE